MPESPPSFHLEKNQFFTSIGFKKLRQQSPRRPSVDRDISPSRTNLNPDRKVLSKYMKDVWAFYNSGRVIVWKRMKQSL